MFDSVTQTDHIHYKMLQLNDFFVFNIKNQTHLWKVLKLEYHTKHCWPDRTNWFWSSTNCNKSVENCFVFCWTNRDSAHRIGFSCERGCVYSCSYTFPFHFVFCAGSRPTNKSDWEKKPITKKLAEFHQKLVRSINCVLTYNRIHRLWSLPP